MRMTSKMMIPLVTLTALVFAPNTGAQTDPTPSPAPKASTATPGLHFSPGTILPAKLDKSLDAKKAKPGDPVIAKIDQDLLSNGKIVIPRNSKILGHVVEAKPSTHEDKSSKLGFVFDKIEVKNAPEIPLSAEVQGIGAPISTFNNGAYGDDMGGPQGGNPTGMTGSSPMGGSGNTTSGRSGSAMGGGSPNMPNPQENAGMAGGQKVTPLPRNFQGVSGLKGLTLSQGQQDSILSSQDHNVKLETGTQILLRAK